MQDDSPIDLFCFGYSYTAKHLKQHLEQENKPFSLTVTSSRDDKKARLKKDGIKTFLFNEQTPLADAPYILRNATHILISIPPCSDGDVVFRHHSDILKDLPALKWVGYLSTTGVYGNRDGARVDENTATCPTSKRGTRRARVEEKWLSLYEKHDIPIHIFRLSGIYGPGRSAIDSVLGGTARRIYKPDHVFNRIHVDDIAQTLAKSMAAPKAVEIYNLADDHPTPSHEVTEYACQLLNRPVPPLVDFEDADLSPMARSFYNDHKIVDNNKIKNDLSVVLKYPNYQTGLDACASRKKDDHPPSPLCINY